jgi:hypothetical protein
VEEVQDAVLKAYLAPRQILQAGRERVIVTLLRRRQYHVLVFRDNPGGLGTQQEAGGFSFSPEAGFAPGTTQLVGTQRSTGFAVDLPAYENDVLNALAQTGGLPGIGSANEILIVRGYFKDPADREALLRELQSMPGDCNPLEGSAAGGNAIRIPLRLAPGQEFSLKPDDIILQTGDIVYLPTRTGDVFYAGGLLPAGEYLLPRDRDLRVLEAIARIRGPLVNGGFGVSNLSGAIVAPGLGAPSPSLLSVLRRIPGGSQVNIRVDLNRAFRDPREDLLVQPGDYLVLQESPTEGFARYVTQMVKFNLIYQIIHGPHETGTINTILP